PRERSARDKRPVRDAKSGGARGRPERPGAGRGAAGRGGPQSGVARLWIGAGRDAGVRPGDLVGAITGEAGISGRAIGAIEITDRYSIVEIAEDLAGDVLDSLRGSKIKGKSVTVRRDRGDGR